MLFSNSDVVYYSCNFFPKKILKNEYLLKTTFKRTTTTTSRFASWFLVIDNQKF